MNTPLRKTVVLGALAALVAAALVRWSGSAPAVSFTTLTGEHIALSGLQGNPVVITFWASDCRTCLLEIPELERVSRDYGPRGVRVIAVAMAYDVPSRVLALVRAAGLEYTVVLDSDARLAAEFGADVVPSTFLVDPDGWIRYRAVGAVDFRRVRQAIEAMLGET